MGHLEDKATQACSYMFNKIKHQVIVWCDD